MTSNKILSGHTSLNTAYAVDNYPYGRKRTTKYYWVDTHIRKGDRLATVTKNPKTGRLNQVHFDIYYTFVYLFINEDGHVKEGAKDFRDPKKMTEQFQFIVSEVGLENLSQTQQDNIRDQYLSSFQIDAAYEKSKYAPGRLEAYANWRKETVKHIAGCDFKDLVSYPPPPSYEDQAIDTITKAPED